MSHKMQVVEGGSRRAAACGSSSCLQQPTVQKPPTPATRILPRLPHNSLKTRLPAMKTAALLTICLALLAGLATAEPAHSRKLLAMAAANAPATSMGGGTAVSNANSAATGNGVALSNARSTAVGPGAVAASQANAAALGGGLAAANANAQAATMGTGGIAVATAAATALATGNGAAFATATATALAQGEPGNCWQPPAGAALNGCNRHSQASCPLLCRPGSGRRPGCRQRLCSGESLRNGPHPAGCQHLPRCTVAILHLTAS